MPPQSSSEEEAPAASVPPVLAMLENAAERLEAADCAPARRTAEWILAEVLEASRAALYARPNRPVPPAAVQQYEALVERHAQGEPLQHVLGHTSFYGLRIQVSPAALVPRPETETVVAQALDALSDVDAPRILDVGTGSGCIALALKHERPDARVYACDVSPDALALARTNRESLGLEVQLLEADLQAEGIPAALPGALDLLVSNPPYIPDAEADTLPSTVREYDPALSLFAGEDPLCYYRPLLRWGKALCRPGGAVVCEAHAEYADAVAALFRRGGLAGVTVDADLSGRPRGVKGRRARTP